MSAITSRPGADAPDTQPASYQHVLLPRRPQDPARAHRVADRRHTHRGAAPEADDAWRDDPTAQNDAEPWVDAEELDNTLLLRLIAAVALAIVALAAASALLA